VVPDEVVAERVANVLFEEYLAKGGWTSRLTTAIGPEKDCEEDSKWNGQKDFSSANIPEVDESETVGSREECLAERVVSFRSERRSFGDHAGKDAGFR
jgi:hypothetical protein